MSHSCVSQGNICVFKKSLFTIFSISSKSLITTILFFSKFINSFISVIFALPWSKTLEEVVHLSENFMFKRNTFLCHSGTFLASLRDINFLLLQITIFVPRMLYQNPCYSYININFGLQMQKKTSKIVGRSVPEWHNVCPITIYL